MSQRKSILIVAAAVMLILAACVPVTRQDAPAPTGDPLAGTKWVLSELNGQPAVADTTVTLQFGTDGRASGTDGCNRYNTSYSVDGSTIQFAPNAAMTMMACPAPIMEQATAYAAALAGAATYVVDGSSLALADTAGATTAVFAAQNTELAGTSWVVTAYNNGKQAVVSVLGGTNLTANFGTDSTVSGNAGCNNFSGGYQVESESTIQIGPLLSTMMACSDPAGVMEQEMQYLAALQSVATYNMEGNSLEMRTADDALAVQFVQAPAEAAAETPAESAGPADAAVIGTVTYLVRSALPNDALVEVAIHNISLADAPPEKTLLAMQVIPTNGKQVPIPYAVMFMPADVEEGALYSIRANIRDGAGTLLFTSTTAIPVITRGNPTENVEILVEPVN